ncbi:MAG: RNB domain-containing ribonuclease, partial [Nitrospinota bacterium]
MKITTDEIIKFMRGAASRPLTMREFIRELNIPTEERNSFRRLIRELVREGNIVKIKGERYGLPEKMNLVTGIVHGHPDGYGFVIPEDSKEDVYINSRNMREVMHGDRVVCRVESVRKGMKKEGRIIRILERGHKTIVGIYEPSGHFGFAIPSERKIIHDIYIPLKYSNKAKRGQAVVAEITAYPTKDRNPEGRIIEVLGYPDNPDIEIEMVIRKYEIPSQFPAVVLSEAEDISQEIAGDEIMGRLDLRDKNIVTIDGERAKDFDDAVLVERLDNGNYLLGVHVADVSHYVKEGSHLDAEAFKRGTSVYFPDRVIPMLPFQLSNEICSLKPKIDRLTMSVFMEFNRGGELLDYRFARTVINSKERMTYTNVAEILEDKIPHTPLSKGGEGGLKERYSYL